jgi:hypothetical protein
MLEQEVYNTEIKNHDRQEVRAKNAAAEDDLFRHYEIKNWNFSPRIYKILAISAIFNVTALIVFAQTSLLTMKGCESPLVGRVCQVLDTVYIGSVLMGTDAEFAVRDYQKTELEDAEITYIDVSGQTPPLTYPEGYFALANPEQFQVMNNADMMTDGGFPSGFEMPPTGSIPTTPAPNNNLLNTTPTLPPAANNPITGDLPSSPLGGNPIGSPSASSNNKPRVRTSRKPSKLPNESPKDLPKLDEETAKKDEPKPEETKQPDLSSLPVAEEIINKKPLQDFGNDVLDKVAAKEVDLTKNFAVVMQGAITKEGKFDPKKSAYLTSAGDEEMINIAKSAIGAIGDSGLLTYLQSLGVENIRFELVQNDKEIYAVITSDQKTDSRAKTVSSGLNNAISIGKMTVKEDDTLALLNAAKVESQGKNFVLNFKLEKPAAQELINRQLKKAEAKRQQQQQPNGTAVTKPNQNTSK